MLLYASITIVIKIRNFVREKIYKWGGVNPISYPSFRNVKA